MAVTVTDNTLITFLQKKSQYASLKQLSTHNVILKPRESTSHDAVL